MALYLRFGLTPAYGMFFVFSAALCAVFWIDLEHMIIPDAITLNGAVIGVLASVAGLIPPVDWKSSLCGVALGIGILYVPALIYHKIRRAEGLGGGDIKLLAMIGAFCGPEGVLFVIFFSSLAGSITGLFGMIFRGSAPTAPIPFGPFLSSSAVFYVFVGRNIVNYFYAMASYL